MELTNIKTSVEFDIWVESIYGEHQWQLGPVEIKFANKVNQYKLIQNDYLCPVRLRDKAQSDSLSFHLAQGCAYLAQVTQLAYDASMLVKIVFFNGPLIELGEINVGIDEHIEKTAKNHGFVFKTIKQLGELLTEQCVINWSKKSQDQSSYFVILAGPAVDALMEEQLNDVPEQFALIGDGVKIPVKSNKQQPQNDVLIANRLIASHSGESDSALKLVKGRLSFVDYRQVTRLRAQTADALERIYQTENSYLKKWDEYGAHEGELLLKQARAVGKLNYSNVAPADGDMIFFISEGNIKALNVGASVEITNYLPPYLQDKDLSWEDYQQQLLADKQPANEKSIIATVKKFDHATVTLANIEIPPSSSEDKFIVLSIIGDKIQVQRRAKARKAIAEGRSANPLLGLIIEENGQIPPVDIKRKKLKGLTPFVEKKVFPDHPPNPTQLEAITNAINTPDMFLIQGPPGTGKTTVICAIIERLNQEFDKTSEVKGRILVSGFQHDAVENIINKLSVNALPTVKFGRRSGEDNQSTVEIMNNWCDEVANNIRSQHLSVNESEQQRLLTDLFNLYAVTPSLTNGVNLLKQIKRLPAQVLTKTLYNRTEQILQAISGGGTTKSLELTQNLQVIRSLRTTRTAFLDDGHKRAMAVLERFAHHLNKSQQAILKKAGMYRQGQALDFLKDLRLIKKQLLQLTIPKPQFRVEKIREDITTLMALVQKAILATRDKASKTASILADFLHELEDNPDGVRQSLEDYNVVYAATTQQAAGVDITRAKTTNDDNQVIYDTIIIDEAARVSPRDLLIPMVQGQKRIILVGDHRQLPHIIDEQIARDMEMENKEAGVMDDDQQLDFLQHSMFEYLFKRLKKLEQNDGTARTVILNKQYRTHPLLGNFASAQFYQPFNESYGSPLPKELFTHNLPQTNRAAAICLDVAFNANKGEKKSHSNSRYRTIEAEAIAKQLSQWMNCEAGKNLTFGVISFYKAQVNEVYKALAQYDISEKVDGNWCVADGYSELIKTKDDGTTKTTQRLRLGTVDAFQGMEFDVVFLSVVRSQNAGNLPREIHQKPPAQQYKMVFGHLMSKNRLCVSMTRQQKVLVVTGDLQLLTSGIGRQAVPELANYVDLCHQQGVVL